MMGMEMAWMAKEAPQLHGDKMAAFQMQLHFRLGPCPEHLDHSCAPSGTWLTSDSLFSWKEMTMKEIRPRILNCSETIECHR